MKKAGRLDLSANKLLPPATMYHSQSMGKMQRLGPVQPGAVPKRNADREHPSPVKSHVLSRNPSEPVSGESSMMRSAVVRPEYVPHRQSGGGSSFFQPPSEPPPRAARPLVVSSSRELLQYVRTHHPSEPIKLPSVGDRGEDSWNSRAKEKGVSSFGNSRQTKLRYGSMPTLPNSQTLTRTIAKFSYRTRTGSTGGVQKPQNQDNFLVALDFLGCKHQTLFGVFDGHGVSGHEVSMFIKKTLPVLVETHFPRHLRFVSSPASLAEETTLLRTAFVSSFLGLNSDLLKCASIDSSFSGSTAVTVLLRGRLVICANAGDSRAILGARSEGRWSAVALSNDHKPDVPEEQDRVERCGGRVEPFMDECGTPLGPARVWIRHEQIPGLAMSRSIGDFVAAQIGVIAEPEVLWTELRREHKFLVLASDGVWEFIPSQECVEMIAPFWEQGNVEGACEKLVKEATSRWKQEDDAIDDITIIVAFLAA